MLGIIDRYIMREIAQTGLAATAVLLVILVSVQFAQVLRPVAEGQLDVGAVGQLLLLTSIKYLTVLIPVALFLAIIMAVERLYRENEASVMAACGMGPMGFYRPLLMVAMPVALLLVWMSFNLRPWASAQAAQLRDQAQQIAMFSLTQAGRFQALEGKDAVFYAEGTESNGELINVFIRGFQNGIPVVIFAPRGHQDKTEAGGFISLTLYDGYRYQGQPGTNGYQVTSFGAHGVHYRVPTLGNRNISVSRRPTMQLLASHDRGDLAELHWRLATPISALVLAILALPLAQSSPRQRGVGLVAGILLYVLYSNLLGIGENWIDHGDVPTALGMWWVHALFLLLAFVLLARRYGWSWMLSWGRRGT
jgi:lipopolysaccharide export system permease protein